MKIQHKEKMSNFEYDTGAIQPLKIMFFPDEIAYPLIWWEFPLD